MYRNVWGEIDTLKIQNTVDSLAYPDHEVLFPTLGRAYATNVA